MEIDKLNPDMVRKWKDTRFSIEQQSRYIQTTWMLSAKSELILPNKTCIRFFSREEAQKLAKLVLKKNIIARTMQEDYFYLQRIKDLAGTTVIEIFRYGNPDDMIDYAQKMADLTEKLAILSSTLIMRRELVHRLLAISLHRRSVFDITIGPAFYWLRSKSNKKKISEKSPSMKYFVEDSNVADFRS